MPSGIGGGVILRLITFTSDDGVDMPGVPDGFKLGFARVSRQMQS